MICMIHAHATHSLRKFHKTGKFGKSRGQEKEDMECEFMLLACMRACVRVVAAFIYLSLRSQLGGS